MAKLPPKDYRQAVEFPREVTLQPIGVVRSPYTERLVLSQQNNDE
jgi:hypothetical protein